MQQKSLKMETWHVAPECIAGKGTNIGTKHALSLIYLLETDTCSKVHKAPSLVAQLFKEKECTFYYTLVITVPEQ